MNTVSVSGRLGRNVELAHTPSGALVAKFAIAVNEVRNYGRANQEEVTYWFDCVAFGKFLEKLAPNMTKGQEVVVSGKLVQSRWTDKNGNDRSKIEVQANYVRVVKNDKVEPMSGNDYGADNGNPYADM